MITVVVGKPGSGKSYDCVKNLLAVLEADIQKGSVRKVYTNLALNVPAIEAYLEKRLGKKVDLSANIVVLEPDFFKFRSDLIQSSDVVSQGSGLSKKKRISDNSLGYWWNRFDDGAYIIIDEIQQYLSSLSRESTSVLLSISQYFSTHRHHRHDIVLITQALTTLSLEVRKYAELVREVVNSKSISIPFPFNISGRDLDILRAGFGVTRQLYRVRVGALTPSNNFRPDFQGEVDVVTTSPEIYACYRTHSKIEDDSSSTDFDLPFKQDKYVKFRAVAWFLRKNAFNFGWKFAVCVLVVLVGRAFLFSFLPNLWHGAFANVAKISETVSTPSLEGDSAVSEPDEVSLTSSPISLPVPASIPLDNSILIAYSSAGLVFNDSFYPVGSLLPNGVRIKRIDFQNETIEFESGEAVYFAGFCFVDYCRRLSSELGTCEDCLQ